MFRMHGNFFYYVTRNGFQNSAGYLQDHGYSAIEEYQYPRWTSYRGPGGDVVRLRLEKDFRGNPGLHRAWRSYVPGPQGSGQKPRGIAGSWTRVLPGLEGAS
ncbi:MAG: hypothetical protein HY518_03845 [Candidatus Aenigmarchaeota archaeon]|nr:hypothetical protein [Candidatus Aenigmarchaeota archaeon]